LMGDLYGGQLLKKHFDNTTHLTFEDRATNIQWIRDQIEGREKELAEEALYGFDAIMKIQNAVFEKFNTAI
jgi:hypothetical protein